MTMTTPPNNPLLTPVARVETQAGHFVKARLGERVIRFPLELLHRANNPHGLRDFLAKRYGILVGRVNRPAFQQIVPTLPLIYGTPRLGWTADQDAFLYGGTVLHTSKHSTRRYEFLGTPMLPRGSWKTQFEGLAELWTRVPLARLIFSLSTVSPFLEPLGAPSLVLHVVGHTGFGKTTVIRAAAIAPFADPRSPLFVSDLSQDTDNYVDTRLGDVHNLPILLDETTLRDPKVMADAAYRIAAGRTKGRLTGPEREYAPAPTVPYNLVCFLSGEDSIRARIEKRGAAARFAEVAVEGPLLPKGELPAWWTFAEKHHGWYGRLLIPWAIAMYFSLGRNGEPLRDLYAGARDGIVSWCPGHPRLLDLLAAVHVGYVLSVHILHIGITGAVTREKRQRIAAEAEEFTHEVYGWLDPRTKIDHVLDAIAGVKGIAPWIEHGFIPTHCLDDVAREFGLDKPRSAFLDFLRHHSIVSKVEPRREREEFAPGQRASHRSYILTQEGNKQLEKRSQDYGVTTG